MSTWLTFAHRALSMTASSCQAVRFGTTPEAVRSSVSTECGWLTFFAVVSVLFLSVGICAGGRVIVVSFRTRRDGDLTAAEEAELELVTRASSFLQYAFTVTGYLKLVIFGSMLNKFSWFGLWQGSEDLGTSVGLPEGIGGVPSIQQRRGVPEGQDIVLHSAVCVTCQTHARVASSAPCVRKCGPHRGPCVVVPQTFEPFGCSWCNRPRTPGW